MLQRIRHALVVHLARCGRWIESLSFDLDQRWAVGFWRIAR